MAREVEGSNLIINFLLLIAKRRMARLKNEMKLADWRREDDRMKIGPVLALASHYTFGYWIHLIDHRVPLRLRTWQVELLICLSVTKLKPVLFTFMVTSRFGDTFFTLGKKQEFVPRFLKQVVNLSCWGECLFHSKNYAQRGIGKSAESPKKLPLNYPTIQKSENQLAF